MAKGYAGHRTDYPEHRCLLCDRMTTLKTYCKIHAGFIIGNGSNPQSNDRNITADQEGLKLRRREDYDRL